MQEIGCTYGKDGGRFILVLVIYSLVEEKNETFCLVANMYNYLAGCFHFEPESVILLR